MIIHDKPSLKLARQSGKKLLGLTFPSYLIVKGGGTKNQTKRVAQNT